MELYFFFYQKKLNLYQLNGIIAFFNFRILPFMNDDLRPSLEKVKQQIKAYIHNIEEAKIRSILTAINSGKLLRSQLILSIAKESEKVISLCAIVEMIHLASLLHDDVIDDAQKRRSSPSINALYGNKQAIMLGDVLYALAFKELASFDRVIIESISQSVVLLSVGEFLDVELSKTFNGDIDAYLDMTYKKTSALIESASFCAGILADKDADKLKDFGKYLGISFQLIDDLLDVVGDEKTLGKPVMCDYEEGKVTLPYILLYQSLEEAHQTKLKNLYKKSLSSEDKNWIKETFFNQHIKQKTLEYISNFSDKASQLLQPDDVSLQHILNKAINRDF